MHGYELLADVDGSPSPGFLFLLPFGRPRRLVDGAPFDEVSSAVRFAALSARRSCRYLLIKNGDGKSQADWTKSLEQLARNAELKCVAST